MLAGVSRPAAAEGTAGSGGQAEVRGESGLRRGAERVPALHQLLGLAEHLVPVLQLSASGVHVGAHHHAAQLVAGCGGGENVIILWSTETTSPGNTPRDLFLSLTPPLKGRSKPPPSLSTSWQPPKGSWLCSGIGGSGRREPRWRASSLGSPPLLLTFLVRRLKPASHQRAEGERGPSRKKPLPSAHRMFRGNFQQCSPTKCRGGERPEALVHEASWPDGSAPPDAESGTSPRTLHFYLEGMKRGRAHSPPQHQVIWLVPPDSAVLCSRSG